ncbi:GMP synthase [glutamine-hydrolyzing]-like [Tamandua tetradactyla]|uniref:GMP synthase [glutamine-hydrolyzing]-like n=1 Tax=Tamandua tetradactyla TaxID=48850 RepID=UPI0040537C9F
MRLRHRLRAPAGTQLLVGLLCIATESSNPAGSELTRSGLSHQPLLPRRRRGGKGQFPPLRGGPRRRRRVWRAGPGAASPAFANAGGIRGSGRRLSAAQLPSGAASGSSQWPAPAEAGGGGSLRAAGLSRDVGASVSRRLLHSALRRRPAFSRARRLLDQASRLAPAHRTDPAGALPPRLRLSSPPPRLRPRRLFATETPRDLQKEELVLLTHGDSVHKVADGFKVVACSGNIVAGIANESKKLYGVQFHPEVGLTENGKVILKNFLYDIAGCSGTFTVQNRELECIREIQESVGTSKVLVLLSGRVDSTVCTALLNHALNQDQVIAVHIDNGLMRKRESQSVEEAFKKLGIQVKVINAAHSFYNGATTLPISDEDRTPRKRISKTLNMTTSPEEKRKIIGDTFVKIANEVIGEMNLKPEEVFLAQGTLRPDLIESASLVASGKAELIKTHHNDTELIRKLREEALIHFHGFNYDLYAARVNAQPLE